MEYWSERASEQAVDFLADSAAIPDATLGIGLEPLMALMDLFYHFIFIIVKKSTLS